MQPKEELTTARLRAPRAAAIAGILFAILLMAGLGLIRLAVPANPLEAGAWLQTRLNTVVLALNLVPFAGIAFLWFMGVVRAHLGSQEDQFFSTVFYGSGLLFLAMIFLSAALAGGMLSAYSISPSVLDESGVITFGRTVVYTITNVYAIRMAGVFMLSLGTIWIRTRTMPRIFVVITYFLALVLLVVINFSLWVIMVFPAWVMTVSIYILAVTMRNNPSAAARAGE